MPIAAILSVVPKMGAALALVRFMKIPPIDFQWRPLLAFIALITMPLGNLGALWQTDVRQLPGWSSVSQSGYTLLAITLLEKHSLAVPALLLFLLGYALANLTLFASIVSLRGRTALEDFQGLAAARPFISAIPGWQ